MPFDYRFYSASFSDIRDVIAHMQQLSQALAHTELHNLRAFNTTYLIITQAVAQKFGQHFFANDRNMEKLDLIFAQYYFDALFAYTQGNTCAPAWRLLFDSCKRNNLHQWQYMGLGVNAHVNHDLPFTLRNADLGPSYLSDFNKINGILFQQIPSVVHSFKEKNPQLEFIKNKTASIYRYGLIIIIRSWRANAWQNYLKLIEPSDQTDKITANAVQIAHHFGAR